MFTDGTTLLNYRCPQILILYMCLFYFIFLPFLMGLLHSWMQGTCLNSPWQKINPFTSFPSFSNTVCMQSLLECLGSRMCSVLIWLNGLRIIAGSRHIWAYHGLFLTQGMGLAWTRCGPNVSPDLTLGWTQNQEYEWGAACFATPLLSLLCMYLLVKNRIETLSLKFSPAEHEACFLIQSLFPLQKHLELLDAGSTTK